MRRKEMSEDGNTKHRIRWSTSQCYVVLLVCLLLCIFGPFPTCHADQDTTTSGTSANTATNEGETSNKKEFSGFKIDPAIFDENADWGTFYDPQNIFCGKYDCYKILGFDYWTFYEKLPTTKDITKAYRALSRHWHPDKNRKKGAKERFVKIARAYEVLTNKEMREEYDFFRDRPDEYFNKYGSSVIWKYAPQSDTTLVLLALLALFSWISLWIKKHRWRTVADLIIKSAVEGLSIKDGGSSESIEVRRQAMEILAERQAEREKEETDNSKGDKGKKKKAKGVDKKETKKQEQEELKAIIVELVEAIHDFGGGFAKPTWRDLFLVKLVQFPYVTTTGLWWWIKYFIRRRRGLDYTHEELEWFTRKAVGDVIWDSVADEEREEMKARELWIPENLEQWKEEEEVRTLSPKERKQYNRWKKKESFKVD